jgi:hypothetical protein
MRWLLLVIVTGCGRLDFEPRDSNTVTSGGDGPRSGDGPAGDGTTTTDAAVTACTSAKPVMLNQRLASTTCVTDLLDGCGPANTQEVVFAFTPPQSAGYNVRAFDPGTMNVSNTTGLLDPTCKTAAPCAGIIGQAFQAGTTVYFVVEASGGGCASIEFLID